MNTPPKKENVQTDVKIDENTQSDADLAKAAAQWKKQKEEKTANVTKSAVKAANSTVKAKVNATDFIDPKPYPNSNPVPLEQANKGEPAKVNEKKAEVVPEAAAQTKKVFDASMEKTYKLVSSLSNAIDATKTNTTSHAQTSVELKISSAYDKVYGAVANTTKKANTTDFIDPKPFPNPTPVPLAKANKGDTPEKKAPEAAPEAAVQVKVNGTANVTAKANTTTSANVTQAAVKK